MVDLRTSASICIYLHPPRSSASISVILRRATHVALAVGSFYNRGDKARSTITLIAVLDASIVVTQGLAVRCTGVRAIATCEVIHDNVAKDSAGGIDCTRHSCDPPERQFNIAGVGRRIWLAASLYIAVHTIAASYDK